MSYIGNQPSSIAFLTDQFSGNGSTTAFTMSVAPASTSSILVAITGVVQDPSTYSIVGTTLTFSAAPPTGTGNISVRYLGIPASGVTTTAYRTVTEFTATAGQTTFTPPSYTVGFINVYRNGAMLGSADYTASNGTTVVLAAAATVGDLVTIESFYVSSVLNAIPATAGAVNSTYLAANLTLTTPTLSSPVTSGTPTGVGVLTTGTSVPTTSGTSALITGVPSWAKRVTLTINGVTSSGAAYMTVQLGSGSLQTTGYVGAIGGTYGGSGSNTSGLTTAFYWMNANTSTPYYGSLVFVNLGSNTWLFSGTCIGLSRFSSATGAVTLSGALDRFSIADSAGGTLSAGSINILYE